MYKVIIVQCTWYSKLKSEKTKRELHTVHTDTINSDYVVPTLHMHTYNATCYQVPTFSAKRLANRESSQLRPTILLGIGVFNTSTIMQHRSTLLSTIAILKSLLPSIQAFAIVFKPSFLHSVQLKKFTTTTIAMHVKSNVENDLNSTVTGSRSQQQLSSTATVDGEIFCEIVDEFGCQALESHCRIATTTSITDDDDDKHVFMDRWVRLQATPDIASMTRSEILQRIDQVQQQQETYGRADLHPREWIPTKLPNDVLDNDQNRSFSVLQFNILAQGLSFGPNTQSPFEPAQKLQEYKAKNSYGGFTSVAHPDVCLDFDLRQWRLLQAILDADCDIVALEEMDRFYGFFLPMLQQFGYEGYFVPKVHSPGVKLGWYSDGCAIFYRTSVFTLNCVDRYSYNVGNQVCLVTRLCHQRTGKMMQIAATHLKAQQKEECEKMRTQQVDQLLSIVSQSSDPTIVAGDFNTNPSSESVKKVQRTLASAYDLTDPTLVTTWKTRGGETSKRVIDYIFYSSSTLQCSALWSIPHQDMENLKLPSLRYPSDHMLIAAKFQFSP